MKRTTLLLILTLWLLIPALSGVAQDDDGVIGPDDYPPGVNPLTGLPLEDPDALDRLPLLVKISNWPPVVRPQSGLSAADHVWELLVEGGVTRFAAVFLGREADHVGPVRSARLGELELVRYYHAIFAYSGASQGTLDWIRADALINGLSIRGGPCPPYCRFPQEGLALEHTLYTTTEDLYAAAEARDIAGDSHDLRGLAFAPKPPDGGHRLNRVTLQYRGTEATWTYDPAANVWLRAQDGEDQIDASTGEQLRADNVVLFEIDHVEQPAGSPDYWGEANYAFAIDFLDEGRVVLFRDGRYYEGRWARETLDDRFTFATPDGEPLRFKPGNTWFQVVPTWFNAYQLLILPDDPPLGAVTTPSLNLRARPSPEASRVAVGYQGDTLRLVGRNERGDWILALTALDEPVWATVDFLDVGDLDVMTLPVSIRF